MRLFLFTDSFPYGNGETFLESELPFLSNAFDGIILIPLYKQGEIRDVSGNATVWKPMLKFNPKNRRKLLLSGIFNFSPIGFACKEFFKKRVYRSKNRLWNFFTSLLTFRALFADRETKSRLKKEIGRDDKIYFYWADKSALLIPEIKKHFPNVVFVRFHGSDLYEEAKNGYIPFREYVFPHIDRFIPVSNNGKEYLLKNYSRFIQQNNVYVGRLGVFNHGLNPVDASETRFHLLSCSNIIPLKRVNLIVEILKMIEIPVKWTHIGSGISEEAVKQESLSLPPHVEAVFLGLLPNKEVITFYRQQHVDLFINTSQSEGVPVSIMEALSFGIPVMATNVGGTSEIVDSEAGMLLDVDFAPAEAAAAIQTFARIDLAGLRKNARNRWEEQCNAEKNYTEFSEFLCSH